MLTIRDEFCLFRRLRSFITNVGNVFFFQVEVFLLFSGDTCVALIDPSEASRLSTALKLFFAILHTCCACTVVVVQFFVDPHNGRASCRILWRCIVSQVACFFHFEFCACFSFLSLNCVYKRNSFKFVESW